MALKLITPAAAVVTLAEAKRHLRVFHDDDDADIEALVETATSWVDGKDGWLGKAVGEQTWDLFYDQFPCGGIRIPLPPLKSVTGVFYVDPTTGLEATLAAGQYEVDAVSEPGWVMPVGSWPATMSTVNAVRIRFVAGYDATPAPIKHAIKLMVGHLYESREAVTFEKPTVLPMAVDALLTPYRNWLN